MSEGKQYKVSFSKTARTLLYEDEKGTILFTFDFSFSAPPKAGNRKLLLERSRLSDVDAERTRMLIATERTKALLESCGYEVKVFGD